MMTLGLALAALLLEAASGAAPAPKSWILRCDIPQPRTAAPGAPTMRTLRIAPKVLQEWRPAEQKFGPNLCRSYACRTTGNGLEGQVSSASLVFSVQVDPSRTRATWRTMGASGLKKTSGVCSIEPETSATRFS